MLGIVKKAVGERLSGDRPSPVRAILASVVTGVVAAGVTYKVLRG
ncbi:MAG TPA: hypothetical protein VGL51_18355 [Solirubrobacteraceae bacterium]|jgi:hypothetical protein